MTIDQLRDYAKQASDFTPKEVGRRLDELERSDHIRCIIIRRVP